MLNSRVLIETYTLNYPSLKPYCFLDIFAYKPKRSEAAHKPFINLSCWLRFNEVTSAITLAEFALRILPDLYPFLPHLILVSIPRDGNCDYYKNPTKYLKLERSLVQTQVTIYHESVMNVTAWNDLIRRRDHWNESKRIYSKQSEDWNVLEIPRFFGVVAGAALVKTMQIFSV